MADWLANRPREIANYTSLNSLRMLLGYSTHQSYIKCEEGGAKKGWAFLVKKSCGSSLFAMVSGSESADKRLDEIMEVRSPWKPIRTPYSTSCNKQVTKALSGWLRIASCHTSTGDGDFTWTNDCAICLRIVSSVSFINVYTFEIGSLVTSLSLAQVASLLAPWEVPISAF